MEKEISISKKIFICWLEKLRNEDSIPNTLVDSIRNLHNQGRLSDPKALSELFRQIKK
jgi:hypothetical protein